MKKIIRILLTLIISFSGLASAQQLPNGSPELRQLEAMGYEIDKSDPSSYYTIASSGSGKIAISKNSERTAITRIFTRKTGLSQKQEYELLKFVNKINEDFTYQTSIGDGYLILALYIYGPHDPKTFAKVVRTIEKADSVFDSYKGLLELLN